MDTLKAKEVYDYIWDLRNCIDDEVFQRSSLEDLGEYFYKKIVLKFPTIKKELIKKMVRPQPDEKLLTDSALYIALCSHIFIKRLPKEVYNSIKIDIVKLASEYISLKSKIEDKIDLLNLSLSANKEKVRRVQHIGNNRRFTNDISTLENQILNSEDKCNQDRTQKEIFQFLKKYLENCMLTFCDLLDADSIEKKSRCLTMTACTLYPDCEDSSELYSHYFKIIKGIDDDINRPEAINFRVKYLTIYDNAYIIYQKNVGLNIEKVEEANLKANEYLNSFPSIDELILLREKNLQEYCNKLKSIINSEKMEEGLKQNIDSCICLNKRKKILNKCITLYHDAEFELFSNIVPIQIEGIFNDFLRDITTFNRFSEINLYSNKVLKEKVAIIWETESGIQPETIAYFMHYFNNLIRNATAHGNASHVGENEATAHELLLDLHSIVYLVTRYGEMERMSRFVQSHKKHVGVVAEKYENDMYFGSLCASLTGEQTTYEYDYIVKYNPIKIAYWLVNPYYEKAYALIGDLEDLKSIRKTFLDAEFWRFVYERLKDSTPMRIKREFLSVINGLFSCGITNEAKCELIKVRKLIIENHLIEI